MILYYEILSFMGLRAKLSRNMFLKYSKSSMKKLKNRRIYSSSRNRSKLWKFVVKLIFLLQNRDFRENFLVITFKCEFSFGATRQVFDWLLRMAHISVGGTCLKRFHQYTQAFITHLKVMTGNFSRKWRFRSKRINFYNKCD